MRQTSIVGFPDTLKSLPQAEQKALQTALDQAASINQPGPTAKRPASHYSRRSRPPSGTDAEGKQPANRAGPPSPHRRPCPARTLRKVRRSGRGGSDIPLQVRGQCPGSGLPAARNAALGGSFSSLGQASVSGAGGLLPSPWFRQGPRRGSPFKRGQGGRSARGRASRPVPRPRAGVRRGLLAPSPVAPPVAQVVSACASPWNHRGRATRPSRASLVALCNGGL